MRSEPSNALNRLAAMELRTLGAQEPAAPSNSWLPIRDQTAEHGARESAHVSLQGET